MEQIQVRIVKRRKAEEINSKDAGREFTVEEIELGVGIRRKSIKYTKDFLKSGAECNAVVIGKSKIRII